MVGFGDFFWWLLWIFYFTAYIFMVFLIISDLFRDDKLNGWWKAVWIIFLVFVPFLTALVYVIARGKGMAERACRGARRRRGGVDDYRPVGLGEPAPRTSHRRRRCWMPARSARASSTRSRARRSETSTSARASRRRADASTRHPLVSYRWWDSSPRPLHSPLRGGRSLGRGARPRGASRRPRSYDEEAAPAGSASPFVPVVGLEPTCPFGQSILSAPRLPFRHTGPARPRTTIP